MITRLRLDATLYAPPSPRTAGQHGHTPRKGERLPTLQAGLGNPATVWQAVTIDRWYSQSARKVEVTSGTALWVHIGMTEIMHISFHQSTTGSPYKPLRRKID